MNVDQSHREHVQVLSGWQRCKYPLRRLCVVLWAHWFIETCTDWCWKGLFLNNWVLFKAVNPISGNQQLVVSICGYQCFYIWVQSLNLSEYNKLHTALVIISCDSSYAAEVMLQDGPRTVCSLGSNHVKKNTMQISRAIEILQKETFRETFSFNPEWTTCFKFLFPNRSCSCVWRHVVVIVE